MVYDLGLANTSLADFDPLHYSNYMARNWVPQLDAQYEHIFANSSLTSGSRVNLDRTVKDSSNDGKFSWGQAFKNFFKGVVSPVTNMWNMMTGSVGGFLAGAAMIAAGIAIVASGGALLLVAAGAAYGAYQIGKFGYKVATAENGDQVEQAFYNLGAGTSAIGLSAWGARGAFASAHSKGATLVNSRGVAISSADDIAAMTRKEALMATFRRDNLGASIHTVRTNGAESWAAFKASPTYTNAAETVQNNRFYQGARDRAILVRDRVTGHRYYQAGADRVNNVRFRAEQFYRNRFGGQNPSTGMRMEVFDASGRPVGYWTPDGRWVWQLGDEAANMANTGQQLQLTGGRTGLLQVDGRRVIQLGDGSVPTPVLNQAPQPKLLTAANTTNAGRTYKWGWEVPANLQKGNPGGGTALGNAMPDELLAQYGLTRPAANAGGVHVRMTDPVYGKVRNYVHDQGILYPLRDNGSWNTVAPRLEALGGDNFRAIPGTTMA